MPSICIVGLPSPLLRRIQPLAQRANYELHVVIAAYGKEGSSYQLKPNPSEAVRQAEQYLDSPEGIDKKFLILPYAEIPDEFECTLEISKDMYAAEVVRVYEGEGLWPEEDKNNQEYFFDSLVRAISNYICPDGPPPEISPADYLRQIAARCERVLIPHGSIDYCDEVERHRYSFVKKAGDAFEDFVMNGTAGATLESFFKKRGLKHAQSGGIVAELNVHRAGKSIHSGSTNTHLKQGDNTSARAAARVYYYNFCIENDYVAIMYAGPHPDSNVSRSIHLD